MDEGARAAAGTRGDDRPLAGRGLPSYYVVRRLLRHRSAAAGGAILLVVVAAAVAAPRLAPFDPVALSGESFAPPGGTYLLGTDRLGRDELSRLVYGARISIRLGLVPVALATVAGTAAGLAGGYYGGTVDAVLMRVIDVLLALPGILLALSIAAILGPSLENVIIAVGISTIPQYARLVRGAVLSVKQTQYIEAARGIGAGDVRIMLRHVFPNVVSPILVVATLGTAGAILTGSTLSFLGLGAQPPTPEWGAMLSEGRNFMRRAWWLVAAPGAAIMVVTLAINLFGDGLRDALDPRLRVD
ncbi:MAG: ABC transporter permease [Armatimonadetes bacterium]|nr:ABC transporter permease [Armatimonadota bacterium]